MSFIIKLLTPSTSTNEKASFLETTISEFYNQKIEKDSLGCFSGQKNSYCYTFDESYSLHENGQKELSFSMLHTSHSEYGSGLNPFINYMQVGTQLLLIDEYENESFFTIKQINHTFKKDNILYQYSCEDSFTYQTIRQNEGYTIINDPSSVDFIGSKNID
jgi:hypothetical protein